MKSGPKRFVGVDGEAIQDRYVLLAAGPERLVNKEGIALPEALDWLAQHRLGARFVGFSFHYDICMMVRDFPDQDILALMHAEPVRFGDWLVSYFPKRILRAVTKGARVELFDVWSFFACSFEEALRRMRITDPGSLIAWGKAKRGKFGWRDFGKIVAYNHAECSLLEQMCGQLEEGMLKQRIRISSWHGPGALAEAVMKRAGVRDEMRRPNLGVSDLFARAYFGGRIETFKIGTMQRLQTYDVNSAYPEACCYLWDQRHGEWVKQDGWTNLYPVGIWHLEWVLPKTYIGPLPFRRPDGRIYFPRRGRGWYWSPEASLAVRLHRGVKVLEGYVWRGPQSQRLPALVRDFYSRRLALKAEDRQVEATVLKLALNSIYGKMAQTVGKAPWHSQAWAGYVTSYVRAKLREAVIGYEPEVVAFATDGVFLQGGVTLPVAEGDRLGLWKREQGYVGNVLGSGLYRLKRDDEERTGVRGGRLNWERVLDQLNDDGYAEVRDIVFVSPTLAILAPNKFGPHRGKWMERKRTIAPWADAKVKRDYQYLGIRDWRRHWCDSTILDGWLEESEPFESDWADDAQIALRTRPELLITPEEI